MPKACASSPTRRPMRPNPTMPSVLPASSVNGIFQNDQSGLRSHSPAFTAASCTLMLWQMCRMAEKTYWATESVP